MYRKHNQLTMINVNIQPRWVTLSFPHIIKIFISDSQFIGIVSAKYVIENSSDLTISSLEVAPFEQLSPRIKMSLNPQYHLVQGVEPFARHGPNFGL